MQFIDKSRYFQSSQDVMEMIKSDQYAVCYSSPFCASTRHGYKVVLEKETDTIYFDDDLYYVGYRKVDNAPTGTELIHYFVSAETYDKLRHITISLLHILTDLT